MEQVADGRYGPWTLINGGVPRNIDGGNPLSTAFCLFTHPRGETAGMTFQVASVRIVNRSGSTQNCGWGVRVPINSWVAGQWTHGTTTYVDDTTDFQDGGVTDAPLETTTNGDGFLVAATMPFNALSYSGATAQAGSPVRVLEYSVAGGSWSSVTTIAQSASILGGGAESYVWWVMPTNWAVLEAGHGTDVPVGKYGLRQRATTAPSTAAVVSSMTVHRIYANANIANNAVNETSFGGLYAPLDAIGENLVQINSGGSASVEYTMLVRARG